MKVLIAEDELLERKAMRKFLDSNFSSIEIIDEAANGREAIEQAKATVYDIIFMDIKMPGISGLDAIKYIQKLSPSSKFILVSAYDSFDFAKQAMHYGIKEYILKPGKKDEIVESILRVKKEMEHETEQQIEKENLMEERFITKLMHHSLDKESSVMLKDYFPSFRNGYFLVFQPALTIDKAEVRTKFAAYMGHAFMIDITDGRIACCVLANMKVIRSDMLIQARKIQLEFGDQCYVGVGNLYSTMEKLSTSYREALSAAYQLAKRSNRKYGFLEKSEAANDSPDLLVQLQVEMEKGNEHESVQLYKANNSYFSIEVREELYFNVKRMMEERNILLPKNTISELDSALEWHNYIRLCCLKFQEHYHSKKLMQKVKEYMDEHYRQGITLEEMAAHVGLSPNYFSNIFKREFGKTFIESLTGRRMNEAKHLIEKNSYSLKEISYMVGYNDPNYFSRVFKKHFQLSPKHFQQQIFKK